MTLTAPLPGPDAQAPPSITFGELLRDYRRAADLTQEALAERAGVSPRSISEFERGGEHLPRRDTVALLARALGLAGAQRDEFERLVNRQRAAQPIRVRLVPMPAQPLPAAASPVVAPGSAYTSPVVSGTAYNLPRSLTSFVGREHELATLGPALSEAPLLTLLGAGGVGKTRLAQELLRTYSPRFADGGWLVELAGLADPARLSDAIAAALGACSVMARECLVALTDYLRPKQLLLVLDNCEHLAEPCARLVAHLLRECPRLHVLATSREPLAIMGELTRPVLPLDLPDQRQPVSVDQLSRLAAVRLFVDRAQAANPSFALTTENAAAIARICVRLDGIPLALELAAAHLRALSVGQLADRLEREPDVLASSQRTPLPRHRTMRAAIDWSHELLTQSEQVLLRRLAVFVGGCTLEMVEQVCSGAGIEAPDVLDLLAQLVDKSMVVVDTRGPTARYRLLEPIRQYSLERLEAAGEDATYRARHAAVLLELAWTGTAGLPGPDEVASLDRIEAEHRNLRQALRWALGHAQAERALRAATALYRFWERRGHLDEGCAWLEAALAGAPEAPARIRGRALNALAFLAWRGGDLERARPAAEQALAITRAAGTPRDLAQALLNLGMVAYAQAQPEPARAWLEESVRLGRQAGRPAHLSLALAFLGRTLLWTTGPHNPSIAALLRESLALAEAAQARYAAGHALMTAGDLAWQLADVQQALVLWRRALVVRAQLADRRGIAGSLERLAWGLAASQRFESAAWLFGAAAAQHELLGRDLRHDEQLDHTRLIGRTRHQLGQAFASAWSAGQAASLDEAVSRALRDVRPLTPATTPECAACLAEAVC